jgi:undecaprenyl diphosphate synthase
MKTPKHIAFIMDGNGRWAQSRGLPRSAGHKAGFKRIPEILEAFIDLGIQVISIFVWSTENWARPKAEVNYLMTELKQNLPKFIKELHKKGIRFHHIGIKDNLDHELLKVLSEAEETTRQNHNAIFIFAFNYGSHAEITDTVRKIVIKYPNIKEISENTISSELWTTGLPDVDILIRTGKEKRLSNFMLWQCAYAKIHFLDKHWPDLNKIDIEDIVESYITEQNSSPDAKG